MLRRKLIESLTARIFFITVLILLGAGAVTFALIAWATPSTYTAVVNDDLQQQVDALAKRLKNTDFEDSGPVLEEFIRTTRADAALLSPDGKSELSLPAQYGEYTPEVSASQVTVYNDGDGSVSITSLQQASIFADVTFANREETYSLYVSPYAREENLAVQALISMAPWLLLALLIFSLLCAFVYSRYITRPILRLNRIAAGFAQLNFDWTSHETRRDEIGALSRSLDQMAARLSSALRELETANRALQREVDRERERERQRTAFFSAASHELKTPITILKGQLTGMLEGVDVYRDRDKYLLRSLQVAGRMEHLIQEMLTISRMEAGGMASSREEVDLSDLAKRRLALDRELITLRGQHLICQLSPGITVTGIPALLEKVMGNLLSNASLYSPEGAAIRIWCGMEQGHPALIVENTGVHISDQALPRLFEPFYRQEESRNRRTGGSGLGLFLVKMILDRHQASCSIENTKEGVRAKVLFLHTKHI